MNLIHSRSLNALMLFAIVAPGAYAQVPAKCEDLRRTLGAQSTGAQKSAPNIADLQSYCERKIVPADSIVAVIQQLLRSEVSGTKRLDDPPPTGMPTGLQLPIDGKVRFDAGAVSQEGLVTLRVEVAGGKAVTLTNFLGGVTEVPASSFQSGHSYRWTLVTRRTSYSAAITIIDEAARAAVAARLAEASALQTDERTKAVLQAAVYDDADLETERDRLVRQLKQP